MIIENKEVATRIRLGSMLYILLYLTLLVLSILFAWSPKYYYQYLSTIVFVLSFVFLYLRKYSYVYYNDVGIKLILRFSSLLPLAVGNYSIEFPKRDLVKVDYLSKYFGLRKYMILYVSTPQGVARFRPVSLSALNKKELRDLQDSLSYLLEENS